MRLQCFRVLVCLLVSVLCLYNRTNSAWASAASGHAGTFVQPDGSRIALRNNGGEWYHWNETEEGYTVVQDSDGFWKYARARANSALLEAVPGAIVGKANPQRFGLKKKGLPSATLIEQYIDRVKNSANDGVEPPPPQSRTISPLSLSIGGPRTVKCVVILAAFADYWDAANSTVLSSKGRPPAEYNSLFNQTNYTTDGAVGSVRDYFRENSYGKLTIDATIVGWVKLPQTEAWYGDNANEVSGEGRFRQLALDAVNAADTNGFNFAQADGDGDGFVDMVHVIYSGHSEAWGGNPSTSVWPRCWSFGGGRILVDGVGLYVFSATSALRGAAASSTSLCRIGEICHEMGHQFGLPDLYDVGGVTQGIGTWCCMSLGNWGAVSSATSDARQPVQFSAHCKTMLGFVQPKVMHSQTNISLPRAEDNAEVHLIRDGSPAEHEYFLVENRQPLGFDSQLPSGLLIWHVKDDNWQNHSGNYLNPAVRLEEAAGGNGLASSRYAVSSQAWKGTTGLAGGFRDATGDVDCNAMAYQSSAYDRTNSPASYTRIRLSNFSASLSNMTYNLQTVIPTVASQTAASSNYVVSWSAASDAVQYEVQEGSPGIVTSFSDGAEDVNTSFSSWAFSGLARRSIGGSKSGSYCYLMGSKNEANTRYLSLIQSMELRTPFTVSNTTQLSFWMMSHISTDRGFFRAELSKDGGVTWTGLENISGYLDPWTQKTYGIAQLNAKGFVAGNTCRLRFVANIQDIWGWSLFPYWGFALDDVALTGVQIQGYTNWVSVNTNVPNPSLSVSGKGIGTYAYRARAFVNGLWQAYSPAALVTRTLSAYETWAQNLPALQRSESADADGDGVLNVF
jgi:M6 family metalloprotease-like protein